MSVCAWNFKRNLGADILSGFIAHIFAKACTKNKIPSILKKMLLYYHLQSSSFKFLRTAFRFVIISDFLPSSSFSLNHMIIDIIIIYLSFIIVIFTNIITSTKGKHCHHHPQVTQSLPPYIFLPLHFVSWRVCLNVTLEVDVVA